jgi:hypothetical protein
MPVTSTPLHSQSASRVVGKESAIVRRATLRRQRGAIERATAWIVLFVSVLGTIAAMAGGWVPLIASIRALQPNWAAIAGGAAAQALLTYLEWHYFDVPTISWPARIADTAATALGYGPLVAAPLIGALAARDIPLPFLLAWCIILIVSLLIAWYPESRLVE